MSNTQIASGSVASRPSRASVARSMKARRFKSPVIGSVWACSTSWRCSVMSRSAARRRALSSSRRTGFTMKSSAPLSRASESARSLVLDDMTTMRSGRSGPMSVRMVQHSSRPEMRLDLEARQHDIDGLIMLDEKLGLVGNRCSEIDAAARALDRAAASLVEVASWAYTLATISGVVQTAANVARTAVLTKPLTARPLVANWFIVKLMSSNPPANLFLLANNQRPSLGIISGTRERAAVV